MNTQEMARRTLMSQGSAALAAPALLRFPQLAQAFPSRPGEEVVPWADQPPAAHGFPLRLIAPGWYGIANVKWLTRVEVRDTRLMNKFMARDYVTLRQETRDGETVWTGTSVGRARLKSVSAKVTRAGAQYRIVGAAWGAPIARVEVHVDGGPWQPAAIDRSKEAYDAWRIWSLDWGTPSPGEHTIASRAVDTRGNVQPAMDDPWIATKQTYWDSNGQVTRRVRIATG